MKFQVATVFWLFFFGISFSVIAQTDRRIEAIRQIYQETNEKIERAEDSEVFLTELIVNKNNASYPAVGVYRSTVKFFYTYGNREKNPYPDRPIKFTVMTRRSAMTENAEFLFDNAGQLIFYFEKRDVVEKRFYLANERVIKMMIGDKQFTLEKEDHEKVKMILAEKKKLIEIFSNSLR